jgi:hypothetical protein
MRPDFITVKQEEAADSGAAVVAMATGISLFATKEKLSNTQHAGRFYYKTTEMMRWLAVRGVQCGLSFNVAKRAYADVPVEIKWTFEGNPAILAVKSVKYRDAEHWVFWDGKAVRDPNPDVGDTRHLDEYEILEIYPLTYFDE